MKRKKRLEKGIESFEKQRQIHEEKRKLALELGQEELVSYYSERPKYFPKVFCSLEYSNWQFEELLKSVAIQ